MYIAYMNLSLMTYFGISDIIILKSIYCLPFKSKVMSKKLFLVLFCLLSIHSWGQNYHLTLLNGAFEPQPTTRFESKPNNDEQYLQQEYCVIQFYQIPSQQEKLRMEQAGIQFLEYIPNNAYLASVALQTSVAPFMNSIRSIFKMPLDAKMDKYCNTDKFPEWALNKDGKVRVMVSYANNISLQQLKHVLSDFINETTFVMEVGHVIRLDLSPADIKLLASKPFISYIEVFNDKPVKEETVTRSNHRANYFDRRNTNGIQLRGNNITVALNDDGVIGPHIDYQGRLKQNYASTTASGNAHGDHCGGIIMAAGNKEPRGEGMASGADICVYEVGGTGTGYPAFDSLPIHYNTQGVRVISTSYGDLVTGVYNSLARTLDIQHRAMPLVMHVFSAGNSGTSDFGYGAGAGWGNITGGHKQAKNLMTVGNLDYQDVINSSSSRGPAYDGRIKPDICAVGTSVYSTMENNGYQLMTGTSMACPGISGVLAQLMEGYKLTHSNNEAPATLLKNVLQNTAEDLGNSGPDFIYGYGRVNARRAYQLISQNKFFIDSVSNGDSVTLNITVPANTGQLRVMTSWPDKEALANASTALINNLNMRVIDPSSQSYNPWVLNSTPTVAALTSLAVRGIDSLNNMEQVTIDNPTAGTYSIRVVGKSVPFGPQTFYVSYEFVNDTPVLTYPIGKESFAPSTTETIRWDALGNSGTFTLEYSTNNGATWTTISSSIAAATRFYNWTVPSTVTGEALMRITRSAKSSTSLLPFSIIGIPTGLSVYFACGDSLGVTCNAVTGATGYKLSVLGNKYMDSVGVSSSTTIVGHSPLITTPGGWYTVQALGANGAISSRAPALQFSVSCPCSGQPSIGTINNNVIAICPSVLFTLSVTNFNTNTITYQWQSSTTGLPGSWTNVSGASATSPVCTTSQTVATYYRAYILCSMSGLSDTTATPVFIAMAPANICYCNSVASSTSDEDILNVTLGSLNNSSTCATVAPGPGSVQNRYSNYTTTVSPPIFMQGSNYSLSLQIGTCGGSYTNRSKIFIDYNQNGAFTDPGEEVYSSASAVSGAHTETGTITIPFTATAGITRMRVINVETGTAANITPCATYSWGETEDYLVTISASTTCSGKPNAGVAYGPTNACPSQQFTVLDSAFTLASGITFQWQDSSINGSWTDIVTATSPSYSVSTGITVPTAYRLVVTCTSSTLKDTSSSWYISLSSVTQCYCIPGITNSSFSDDILNVTYAGINYSTTYSSNPGVNGYNDFTSSVLPAQVTKGNVDTFKMTINNGGTEHGAMWIDWNQNGIFDTAEYKYIGTGATPTVISQPITVPLTAAIGTTRMRVRSKYSSLLANTDPCAAYTYGETEDYLVVVNAPLAITLKDISANNLGAINSIDWRTESELSSDVFELQRSKDGVVFEPIYTIAANGRASSYTYLDKNAFHGTNYYRLRMIQANGSYAFSKVVTATVKDNIFNVHAYPNPVSKELMISVSGVPAADASIQLTDLTGKMIQSKLLEGMKAIFDMSGLANGVYLLKYQDANHSKTIRVTKQ